MDKNGNMCEKEEDALYRFKYMRTDYDTYNKYGNLDYHITWLEFEIKFVNEPNEELKDITIPFAIYSESNAGLFDSAPLDKYKKMVVFIKFPKIQKSKTYWRYDNYIDKYYVSTIDTNNLDRYDNYDLAIYVNSCARRFKKFEERVGVLNWNSTDIQNLIDILNKFSSSGMCCTDCANTADKYVTEAKTFLEGIKSTIEYEENTGEDATEELKPIVDKYVTSMEHYMSTAGKGNPRTPTGFVNIFDDISYYIPTIDSTGIDKAQTKVSVVLTIITNIGMVLTVLMLAIIGIKYMLGSVEEKAEYKKDMIPYLIGAGLLFGISVIVKILAQIGDKINNI